MKYFGAKLTVQIIPTFLRSPRGNTALHDKDNMKIVSLRVNAADLDKVKTISRRLHVRHSTVMRFALKDMLCRLAPLYDRKLEGVDLMPMFIEFGNELVRQFDFDQAGLERVINDGLLDTSKRVDPDDIALLAMGEAPDSYRFLRLRELCGRPIAAKDAHVAVRDYLYEKYIAGLSTTDE